MRKRILGIFVVMLMIADFLIISFYMIGTDEKIKAKSLSQGIETLKLSTQRAPILDRNLNPLTETTQAVKGLVFPDTNALTRDEKWLIATPEQSNKPVIVDLKGSV